MKTVIEHIHRWYVNGWHWWLPVPLGLVYAFAFAPFNAQTHPKFFIFPFFGFCILVPLFCFAIQKRLLKASIDAYLFGIGASFSQYYWIAGVAAEGLRHVIILGSIGLSMFLALYFLIPALIFRFLLRRFPRLYILIFPSAWILFEFFRGWGELSLPWNYLGYTLTPVLAVAQLASVVGVFGLSMIVVLGNILIWELLRCYLLKSDIAQKWLHIFIFAVMLLAVAGWGMWRLNHGMQDRSKEISVSLVQTKMDQAHWGDGSLDSCFDITGAMVMKASRDNPNLIVLSESALFCYLVRQPWAHNRVIDWSDSVKIPIITGALHWERSPKGPTNKPDYSVYNTAFLIDTSTEAFEPYFKIRLLPFSEAMPFEAQFPILNRLNLGEADFARGIDEKIYSIGSTIKAGPFICFEIVFPDFVRNRVQKGANLLVNITNDGWWGKSNGPYHHAIMSQMRSIENGVSLARCANTGISMLVDQYGRIVKKTALGERTILTGNLSTATISTAYTRFGDWPLMLALGIVLVAIVGDAIRCMSRKKRLY